MIEQTRDKFYPVEIVIHHTADRYNGPQFHKVNAYHRAKDFPESSLGYFVGYHYLIEHDGTTRQAREDMEEGAHTKGHNFGKIGIGIAGHFDFAKPTEQQRAAFGKLLNRLMARYKISITKVKLHRDYAFTSCPGHLIKQDYIQSAILYELESILTKLKLWVQIWSKKLFS